MNRDPHAEGGGSRQEPRTRPTRGTLLPVGDDGCHGGLPRHNPLPTTTGRTSEDGGELGIGAVVRGAGRGPAGSGSAAQREGKAGGEPVFGARLTLEEGRRYCSKVDLSHDPTAT
eukprot:289973-Rhodomonas_salina.1